MEESRHWNFRHSVCRVCLHTGEVHLRQQAMGSHAILVEVTVLRARIVGTSDRRLERVSPGKTEPKEFTRRKSVHAFFKNPVDFTEFVFQVFVFVDGKPFFS